MIEPTPAEIAGASLPRLEPGARIEQYEIIRSLGRGGMGEVLLARDTRLGRLAAIKLLMEHGGDRAARFLVEARVTARVSHENIVVIHELGEHQGAPYLVLEYLAGSTLREHLDQHQDRARADRAADLGLPPARAVELMIPVVRALVCAHEHGINHRDLKPSNIMLTDAGTIKVLDFGIAQVLDDPEAPASRAGAARERLVGTQPYMSPEQWSDEALDARTDVWSAGIILAEMLLGRHPLAPLSWLKLAGVGALHVPMPSVAEARPELGRLASIVDRCLRKRREDRLGSARELLDELTALSIERRAPSMGEARDPYPGLTPFREGDATRFFGRARAVTQVVERLADQPLLAVVGPSGGGKSSFVRAGLIPALGRSGEAWSALVVRPGARPLSALAELLVGLRSRTTTDDPAVIADERAVAPDRDAVAAGLRAEPGLLGTELRARARRRLERILLFVDQLEELYTLAPEDERSAFLACLGGVADDAGSPLRVVLAIRSDFLDRVTESEAAMAGLHRGLMLLPPMDREGLREALLCPLGAVDHRFDPPELVEEMLDAVAHTPGALPLLQFTAAMLWDARDRSRRALTAEAYHRIGGVAGTLAGHAEAVLHAMSAQEQQLARAALLRLVSPERTRAPASRRELAELGTSAEAMDRVLGRLVDARLLVAEGRGDSEPVFELAHESLIARWPTLARWVADNQEDAAFVARVRRASQEWIRAGEADGLLWRAQIADEARRFRDRYQGELAPGEVRFLAAVIALADRSQRQRRRTLIGVAAASIALALVMGSLAVRERAANQRARAETSRAQVEAARTRDALRLAAAREQQRDPTKVLMLLREIEDAQPPQGWSALAKQALEAGVARAVFDYPMALATSAWSPDGERLVVSLADATLRVQRVDQPAAGPRAGVDGEGSPVVLAGHALVALAVAWSPDGRRIASASRDKTVRVWSADGKGSPIVLAGHGAPVLSVAWSPDGSRLASASDDKTVRVWSADGKGEPVVIAHSVEVSGVAWSPDGSRIAVAAADKVARIWSADGKGEPLVLRGHTERVRTVAWSPDGSRLASASYDKTVRVWRADGQGEPLALQGHADAVLFVAFGPDGKRIASGSKDRTARVWNADGTGTPLVFTGHTAPVWTVSWSPDGRSVVTASNDNSARIWSTSDSVAPVVLTGRAGLECPAVLTADGQSILAASTRTRVSLWAADGSGAPRTVLDLPAEARFIAPSPDGRRLATAAADGALRIVDADGLGEPLLLQASAAALNSVTWSPDGKRVACGSVDGAVRVWSADGEGSPLVLTGHGGAVWSVPWSPDGKRLASASSDGTVRVWSADGQGEPRVFTDHTSAVIGLEWSPDGQRLASGSNDRTVRVWSVDGGRPPVVLSGHTRQVNGVTWSPDGRRIASAGTDGTLRVWSADGRGDPLVLSGHTEGLLSVAWSRDGSRIVSAAGDQTIRVWRNLDPIVPGDPRLWAATSCCLTLAERVGLLGLSDEQGRAQRDLCQRRAAAIPPR